MAPDQDSNFRFLKQNSNFVKLILCRMNTCSNFIIQVIYIFLEVPCTAIMRSSSRSSFTVFFILIHVLEADQ